MKKLLLCATLAVSLTSCYNTRLLVGNVEPIDPVVEVNKVWNHQLIYGIVPLSNATMNTTEYVDNCPNYVVKTNMSFLNGLVSTVTLGIYTPTQTTYYIPLSEVRTSK